MALNHQGRIGCAALVNEERLTIGVRGVCNFQTVRGLHRGDSALEGGEGSVDAVAFRQGAQAVKGVPPALVVDPPGFAESNGTKAGCHEDEHRDAERPWAVYPLHHGTTPA